MIGSSVTSTPKVSLSKSDPSAVNVSENGRIGVWTRQDQTFQQDHREKLMAKPSRLWLPDPMMEKFFLPYLEDKCFSVLPPRSELEHVFQAYKDRIQPWYPIFNHTKSNTNCGAVKLATCFMVYQLSSNSSPRITASAQEILSAVITLLDFRMISDSLIRAQLYVTVAFFVEGNIGSERASEYTALAVHCAKSRGLRLEGKQPDLESIFLCIWAIDRLNAAIHGHLVVTHNADVGRNI
jgi:hypothetical protein